MARKKISRMTLKECEAEKELAHKKRMEAIEKMEPLRKKCTYLYGREQCLENRIAKIKSRIKKVDWKWLLSSCVDEAMEKHRYRERVFDKLGLDSDGYYSDTEQACVGVCFHKNNSKEVAKALKGLKLVLPHVKSLDKGYIILSIHERTLSQHGIYNLWVRKNGLKSCLLKRTSYGRTDTIQKFKSLREALVYISKNHYCDGDDSSDE